MVLGDLGKRINTALGELTQSSSINQELVDGILKEICTALLESDVNVRLVGGLRKSIKKRINLNEIPSGANKKRVIHKAIYDELVALVDPHTTPYVPKKGRPSVILFVGLQGAGKTTSCTKLALYYSRRGLRTCLVCADTFRAGAFDQLKQNATKANIPFYGSYVESDPVKLSRDGVEKFKKERFDVIIVDTSGRHRQADDLFEEMVQISDAVQPQQTIMVIDASIGQAAEAQSMAFKETAHIGAILISKMDGGKGGGALSAVAATGTPIVFVGTGEHVHDLERFEPKAFISKLLGMGDIAGLMEHVQTLRLDQKDTMRHIQQGIFTLRDLRDQFSNIAKMGPLSKMAAMIPGMPSMEGNDQEGSQGLKRMVTITDSMTEKELDSDGKLFIEQPTRMLRVARGSGTSLREVEDVLSQHRMMAQMAKRFGKSGMASKMQGQQKPGPGAKPGMLGNLANMANMAGMGGMGGNGEMDMNKMMQMMQTMGSKPKMQHVRR